MTDQQNHAHLDGSSITIRRARADSERGRLFIATHDAGTTASTYLATDRLLTMIDIIDPAAMRAYFRETVSEADSPEDIDERVPPREALLTDAQERRLYLIEQLTKTLPADESPALAHWIITRGMAQIEDLTLSGEDLHR